MRTLATERKTIQENYEKGDAVLEMAVVLPLMLLIVAFILLIGPYPRVIIATDQASYDCAMSAAQSLSFSQGYSQGVTTAMNSFEAFDLPSDNATIQVFGNWGRGGQVGCTISYEMPLGLFPMAQVVNVPSTISHTTVLPVQYYKSDWRGE